MDRQHNSYSGRFGESQSGNRRPTGSYRSQPSGGYKSRPGYGDSSRPSARTAPGDSYTRRPDPREQADRRSSRERKRRRRARRLRIALVLLLLILLIAGAIAAIVARSNRTVHQMPTVVRTADFENVTITEEA